jgi:hypothetical protein
MDTNNKINGHFLDHPHIFINDDNKVIAKYLFNECNDEDMIENILEITKAKNFVCLCDGDYTNSDEIIAGYTYENNLFYPDQPHASWIKDETSPKWIAPISEPSPRKNRDGKDIIWIWNEERINWDEAVFQEFKNEDNQGE